MNGELSDAALIRRCKNGDEAAWVQLVQRYERLVYSVPRKFGLDSAETDDVFQSTWVALHKNLRKLKQPGALPAWLVTTARRACWDMRRGADYERSRNVDPIDGSAESWVDNTSPEETVIAFQSFRSVQKALKKLGERCRQLLHLLYYAPKRYAYRQIAERLNIPIGTIGPTRARCLEKLSQQWHIEN